jgi:hypothetical protein
MSQPAPGPRIKPELIAAIGGLLVGIAAVAGLFIRGAQDNANPATVTTAPPSATMTAPTITESPDASSTTHDASGYRPIYQDRQLVLSTARCIGGDLNGADFDAPRVLEAGGSEKGLDIAIGNCGDSRATFNLSVGADPSAQAVLSVAAGAARSPADCASAVETQPTTGLTKPRLPLSLCVRTSDGAIALVRLLRFRSDLNPQALTITASLWVKP